jgi:hypothetical protein
VVSQYTVLRFRWNYTAYIYTHAGNMILRSTGTNLTVCMLSIKLYGTEPFSVGRPCKVTQEFYEIRRFTPRPQDPSTDSYSKSVQSSP